MKVFARLISAMQADLLSSILSAISKRVNHQSFNTWFKPISHATRDDSTIYLKVPNEIFRDWITNNYFDVIEESLQDLNLEDYILDFLVEEQKPADGNGDTATAVRRATPKPLQEISSYGIAKVVDLEAIALQR